MFTMIFIFIACIIILFVLYLNKGRYSRTEILRRGIRTQGEVTDLDLCGLDVFYRLPVVRFKTKTGQYMTCTSSTKSPIGEYTKGQKVEVCYLPAAPDQFVIVSGFDVLINSETDVAKRPYRLAKGQERRVYRKQRLGRRNQ